MHMHIAQPKLGSGPRASVNYRETYFGLLHPSLHHFQPPKSHNKNITSMQIATACFKQDIMQNAFSHLKRIWRILADLKQFAIK